MKKKIFKEKIVFSFKKSHLMLFFGVVLPLTLVLLAVLFFSNNEIRNAPLVQPDLNAVSELQDENTSKKPFIRVTVINPDFCPECINLNTFVSNLEKLGLETKKFFYSQTDENAKKLLEKYKIERIPTVLVSGDIDSAGSLTTIWQQIGTREKDNTLVLRNVPPVFYDLKQKRKRGILSIVMISDKNCLECSKPASKNEFALLNPPLYVAEEKTLNYPDKNALDLIKRYDINTIPTTIVFGELEAYPNFSQLKRVFSVVNKNVFVLKIPNPLYLDLRSGKITGKVNVTYIYDSNCGECTKPEFFENIFKKNFGLKIGEQRFLDANSKTAKNFIERLGITFLPNVVLTGDYNAYDFLLNVWQSVGSESNKRELFLTNTNVFGTQPYLDLNTGKIVGQDKNAGKT